MDEGESKRLKSYKTIMPIIRESNQKSLVVLIPTYNPDEAILINELDSLLKQESIKFVIIIDSSNGNILENKIIPNDSKIIFKHVCRKGLASSLNVGISIAKNTGCDFVLILEDDTILTINLEIVFKHVNSCSKIRVQDIMSFSNNSFRTRNKDICPFFRVKTNITNGLMVPLSIFDSVKFREEFFMDQIDIDFLAEANKRCGSHIYQYSVASLWKLPIGRSFKSGFHTISLYRYFLLLRNSFVLMKEGKTSMFNFIIYGAGYGFKSIFEFGFIPTLTCFLTAMKDAVFDDCSMEMTTKRIYKFGPN